MAQMISQEERERRNLRSHVLYRNGDPRAPDAIKDRNGDVCLSMCVRCGAGEAQLYDESCIERMLKKSAEILAGMTPLDKAISFARQRRSWVVGEMMLGDDGKEGLSRERAEELYAGLPEGALLAELERRMAEDKPKGDAAEVGRRAPQYGDGKQPWDFIKEEGWAAEFAAGNVLKYAMRHARKNGEDDLKKARWYYHELTELASNSGRLSFDRGVLGRLTILLRMNCSDEVIKKVASLNG